jgi:hypothetical protein
MKSFKIESYNEGFSKEELKLFLTELREFLNIMKDFSSESIMQNSINIIRKLDSIVTLNPNINNREEIISKYDFFNNTSSTPWYSDTIINELKEAIDLIIKSIQ